MHVESCGMALELTDQTEGGAQLERVAGRHAKNRRNWNLLLVETQNVNFHAQSADLAKDLLQRLYNGALKEGWQYFNGTAARAVREFSGKTGKEIKRRFRGMANDFLELSNVVLTS